MTTIYTLACPINKDIRYVGRTTLSLKDRLSNHLSGEEGKERTKWIKNLKKHNKVPIIEELEIVNSSDAKIIEKYWINQMLAWGFNLTNNENYNIKKIRKYKKIIDTETIRIRVSKSLLKRTEARAEAEFLTVSSIVRKALTLYLQEQWWLITKKKK